MQIWGQDRLMALTTTDSLTRKGGNDRPCDKCGLRVKRLTSDEQGKLLCDNCAPAKLVIGRSLDEE
jgi:hypothetical protein